MTAAAKPRTAPLADPAARPSSAAAPTDRPPLPAAAAPVAPGQQASVGAAMILAAEARVRAARTETEIVHLVANELRKLLGARQAIVLRLHDARRWRVACVSSVVLTDKDTPFLRWIEGMARRITAEHGVGDTVAFDLPAFVDPQAPETRSYPFTHFVWQPLRLMGGETFAAVLVARERPWSESESGLAAREASAFASAWAALHGAHRLVPRRRLGRPLKWIAALALALGAAVPVPMTALAPVEIVARNPQRVTAPIDGVVKEILVDPNRPVRTGQPILRFDQTTLLNKLKVAEQEAELARARFERATQAAFGDDKARHEIAQARAELDLKDAERRYAADLLARSLVKAERDGVLVYTDKDRWIGRPVRTGERIMQIVDPAEVAARIELAVADAIVVERDATVRLFLDASPLTAIPARLIAESYHAEANATQQLVYRLHAELAAPADGLRLGARGTAQLQGRTVPLAFYLLRRPISALRQHIGL